MITSQDVIYFVLTDRFRRSGRSIERPEAPLQRDNLKGWHGGDFDGLIEGIPYLKNLGITAVWITPVYISTGEFYGSYGYHGYWALDFEKVDPHLYQLDAARSEGSKVYLKNLVDRFHQEGIKVILDMVVNHTGYGYREIAYADKRFKADNFNKNQPGSVTEEELSGLPDLDHDQPYVADYFIQNIVSWIKDTGIDGIRMDTAKHVEPMFWYYFKATVKILYPEISLIGEVLSEDVWDIPYLAGFQKQYDFDTVFDFPLRKKIKEVFIYDAPLTWLARPRLEGNEVRGVLDKDSEYANPFRLVTLLDNHDMPERIFTAILDHVGYENRDWAQRIMKLIASFMFTTRGIPQIYYGNEIAMEGHGDPDNRRDFPWDKFDNGYGIKPAYALERNIYDHISTLIQLRKAHLALSCGYLLTLWADHFAYVYLRAFGDDVVIVAINNGHDDMPLPLPVPFAWNSNIPPRLVERIAKADFKDACDDTYATRAKDGKLPVMIPGKTARLLIPA